MKKGVWVTLGVLASVVILFSLAGGFNDNIRLSPGDDSKSDIKCEVSCSGFYHTYLECPEPLESGRTPCKKGERCVERNGGAECINVDHCEGKDECEESECVDRRTIIWCGIDDTTGCRIETEADCGENYICEEGNYGGDCSPYFVVDCKSDSDCGPGYECCIEGNYCSPENNPCALSRNNEPIPEPNPEPEPLPENPKGN